MGGGNERICVGNRLSDGRTAAMQFALRPKMNLLALLLLAFSCHGRRGLSKIFRSGFFIIICCKVSQKKYLFANKLEHHCLDNESQI